MYNLVGCLGSIAYVRGWPRRYARSSMMEKARDTLRSVFGHPEFRGQQEAIVRTLLQGKDALVLMPTGAGKSLCYQLPALLLPGTAVVVSPLIALMQDQVDALQQFGVRAAYLNSSLDSAAQRAIEVQLQAGQLDLLYLAPERLLQERSRALLSSIPLALVAIDEAHCVSSWGHDFRPEYSQLAQFLQHFPKLPRIALTATADPLTREDICEQLHLQQAAQFISSFDRPNIFYEVLNKSEPRQQLLQFLRQQQRGSSGIVYCLGRKRCEQLAVFLQRQGYDALPYHARLADGLKLQNQRRFVREDGVIIVATIAFGMGINKPDVRFVVHMDVPKSLEGYYQETGRAGRDGEAAQALLLYGLGDAVAVRRLIADSPAEAQYKQRSERKLEAMLAYCESVRCRRQVLLDNFAENYPQACGHCDVCCKPPQSWDASIAAQKLLSCVVRSEQRFGAGQLIDILLGRLTDKVQHYGHQRLSTFGIGKELSEQQWRSVVRQLIAEGLLSSDQHRSLKLGRGSREVLRGTRRLMLRQDRKASASAVAATSATTTSAITTSTTTTSTTSPANSSAINSANSAGHRVTTLQPEDNALWEALRRCRLELSQEQNIPAFMIFHDSVLRQMAKRKPTTLDAFADIPGVGSHKLQHYGKAFVRVIRQHVSPNLNSPSLHIEPPAEEGAMQLEHALRRFRLELAQQRGVPASQIFRDHTLQALLEHKPQDLPSLLALKGLTNVYLQRQEQALLEIIRRYKPR